MKTKSTIFTKQRRKKISELCCDIGKYFITAGLVSVVLKQDGMSITMLMFAIGILVIGSVFMAVGVWLIK